MLYCIILPVPYGSPLRREIKVNDRVFLGLNIYSMKLDEIEHYVDYINMEFKKFNHKIIEFDSVYLEINNKICNNLILALKKSGYTIKLIATD